MRPQIPENLEEQIEEVYKKAGYTTETEFIRGAIRHHIEDARVQSQPLFNPDQLYNAGDIHLGTNPENNSEVYTDIFNEPLGNMFVMGYIGTGKSYLSRRLGEKALDDVENLRIVEIDFLGESKYSSAGEEMQEIKLDAHSNLSLLEPVTGKPELDSKIVTESIQSQSDIEAPLSFRQLVEHGLESDVGVQEHIGSQLSDENGEYNKHVLNALDFIRPFTAGEYSNQRKKTEFDITDKRVTSLKPKDKSVEVPTVVEAYRQAMRTDDPVLIMFDEAHVILGEGYGWFLDLYDGHDNVGTILVSQEDNPTHDSYIDAVFNRTDDFLAFHTSISRETAARLELNSKQAEKLEDLYTYKNDNHESEIMYRKRNQDWILMNPTIGD